MEREGKEGGAGKEGNGKRRKDPRESKRKEAKVKKRGFVDGSHKWGWEGSDECRRVVIEESGVSKSSRGGLYSIIINFT